MRSAALSLLAVASILTGQAAADPHFVEIKIPRGVDSARVFIRYVLDGDFGGWVDPRAEVSSYFIGTTRNGQPGAHLKALIYAPGCLIQAVDLPLSGSGVQPIAFECRRVGWVETSGVLSGLIDAQIQARYTGSWVQEFLGLGAGIVTFVPLADAKYYTENGRFHLSIPDFSSDDRSGEFQFWVVDRASGKTLARLIPLDPATLKPATLKSGVPVPAEIKFAVCGTRESRPHDAFGFSFRAQEDPACGR